jgi:hypothetical protein
MATSNLKEPCKVSISVGYFAHQSDIWDIYIPEEERQNQFWVG